MSEIQIKYLTKLHSSRMHTACLLTVSPSMHCAGGGTPYREPGGESSCQGGILAKGGLFAKVGFLDGGEVCLGRGVCPAGGRLLGKGGGIPDCNGTDPPPWTE